MSPGAQSRDDTPVGGGHDERDTASQPPHAPQTPQPGRSVTSILHKGVISIWRLHVKVAEPTFM